MGVHEFDQIRWLTGRRSPTSSSAQPASRPRRPGQRRRLVELDGRWRGVVSLGRRFPHGDCCWVELMGTEGTRASCSCGATPGERVFEDALVAQAEAFADAVRGAPQRGATGEDAVRAIKAADRATRSLVAPARVPA